MEKAIKDAESDFKKFYISRGQLVSLKPDKIQAKLTELEELYDNLCLLSDSLAKKYRSAYEKFKNILFLLWGRYSKIEYVPPPPFLGGR